MMCLRPGSDGWMDLTMCKSMLITPERKNHQIKFLFMFLLHFLLESRQVKAKNRNVPITLIAPDPL